MFRRILVPMEGSARDAAAVEVARRLALRMGAGLVLLRVEEPVVSLDEVVAAQSALERQVRDLRLDGVEARHVVEYGRAEAGIAEAAAEQHADLIVLAPQHRTLLEALWHPSVTARMFSRAPAPLLIWPEQPGTRKSSNILDTAGAMVIVPLDGSEVAEQALPFALSFAREYGRPVLLVRVVAPLMLVTAGPEAYRVSLQAQAEFEHEARRYLAVIRRRIARESGCLVQSMVLRGVPERMLLRVAQTHEGSLLVMSTHGRSGITRLVAGSVATAVMRDSPLPLMVVPPHVQLNVEREAEARAPVQISAYGQEASKTEEPHR